MPDLREFTLWAREKLTAEARELLLQVYGLQPTGVFLTPAKLPALSRLSDAMETRRRLERLLADEQEAGLTPVDAHKKLVKEVAFTHLNRLVALKLMESRKLIRGAIDRYHDSNGFKFYLASHDSDLKLFEQGSMPQNDLGEGPGDRAYRNFLLQQYGELANEIKVLFDGDNLPSRLFPRPRVLREIIERMNTEALGEAWAPENEETIGWVYQFFNDEEKAAVFYRLYKEKKKIQREDIPAATQLFTPRWMVQYLVHNTLGRLWLEMHPDSRLRGVLNYVVPFEQTDSKHSTKRAVDIHVLDPACGTMHFGLVAFDVLFEMYVEELEKAGSRGWPLKASVDKVEEIPARIVDCNLYGIDIDLRALQLSALTLYLKARSKHPATKIRGVNLACADVSSLTDAQIDAFLRETHLQGPIVERSLRTLWTELKIASDAGSLSRPEDAVKKIIQEEKTSYDRERRGKLPLPDLEAHFDQAAENDDFWDILESKLFAALDDFVSFQREHRLHEEYFVGELDKGFRLFRLLRRRYDVVLCNPPYSGRKNMNEALRRILSSLYPKKDGDLFSAFISRCQELTKTGGKCGMVTIHSFMFISSYEPLRDSVLGECSLESIAHLGTRTEFEIANKTAQGFVLFTYAKGDRSDRDIVCFRLAKEGYGSAKREALEVALTHIRTGSPEPHVFFCKPSDFAAIPGSPWVYWLTPGLRNLFRSLPKLGDTAQPRQGLATADNFRFLRYWWEVGGKLIGFGCNDAKNALKSSKQWFPYMKGGGFKRWYGNQQHVVNWLKDGAEIKEHICLSYPYLKNKWQWVAKNTDYYFCRGVTYSYLTVAKFSARLSPGGFIFDVAGSSLFPDDVSLVLAVMNSEFAAYALKLINPTVNFQVGDVARLPTPKHSSLTLRTLVDEAIKLAKANSEDDETSYDFIAPPDWAHGTIDVEGRRSHLADVERQLDEEVYGLYGVASTDRAAIESELLEDVTAPILENGDEDNSSSSIEEVEIPEGALTRQELAHRWVSYAVGVALGRFAPGIGGSLGSSRFTPEMATKLRCLTDSSGLMVLEAGHPDDLAARVIDILRTIYGDAQGEEIIRAASGSQNSLREATESYLLGAFFKDHVRRYRKRPIYWPLQSPGGHYSLYLFHERACDQTLAILQGKRYLGGQIHRLESELREAKDKEAGARGGEKTGWKKKARDTAERLEDLKIFDGHITTANNFPILDANGNAGTVRWAPEFDDGVLLNAAPLHQLTPFWKRADSKLDLWKTWLRLEKGEYDWAKTAMRYWPHRVLKACRKNKSFAIAHGLA